MLFNKKIKNVLLFMIVGVFVTQKVHPVIFKAVIFAKQLEDGIVKRVIVCDDSHADFYGECGLRASAANKSFLENFLSKAIFNNPQNPVEVLIEDVSSSTSLSYMPREITSLHFDYEGLEYESSSFLQMMPLIKYNPNFFMPILSKKFIEEVSVVNIDPRYFFGTLESQNLQSQGIFGKYVTRYGLSQNADAIINGIRLFGNNSSNVMLQQIFFDLSNHCQTSFNNFKKVFISDLAKYFQEQSADHAFLEKIKTMTQFSINTLTNQCIKNLVTLISNYLNTTNDYYQHYMLTKFANTLQHKLEAMSAHNRSIIHYVIKETNKVVADLEKRVRYRQFFDANVIRNFTLAMNEIIRFYSVKIREYYAYFKWCSSDLQDQNLINQISVSNNIYDFVVENCLNLLDDDVVVPSSDILTKCRVLTESVEALALQRISDQNNKATTFVCFAGSAHIRNLINCLLQIGYVQIKSGITYQGFAYGGPDLVPVMTESSLTNLARLISDAVVQWINMSSDEVLEALHSAGN